MNAKFKGRQRRSIGGRIGGTCRDIDPLNKV